MSGDPALERPRLRSVEAIPASDGRVCLRDPQGFADKLLLLPPQALLIVSLFDGGRSLREIQAEVARRSGELLFEEPLRELIGRLDEALFLESERFARARARAIEEFAAAPVREALHAGVSYAREPEALRRQLDALLAAAPAKAAQQGDSPPPGHLRALIAPHIDLERGGACYAAGYGELARAGAGGTFVVLGVAHAPSRRRYALCAKDFATPLGLLPADRELIADLRARCRTDFLEEEFLHRSEHSVEFQALFLRYVFRDKEVKILPVLCSCLPALAGGGPPESDPEAEEFLAALGAALAERGREVCLVAGADLAHVGRRFGQALSLTPELLRDLERRDRAMIDGLLARDAAGFFHSIQQEQDRRNVCGVPALYTLLRLLEAGAPPAAGLQAPVSPGRLLGYGQAPDPASDSVVTFMSAAFYDAT